MTQFDLAASLLVPIGDDEDDPAFLGTPGSFSGELPRIHRPYDPRTLFILQRLVKSYEDDEDVDDPTHGFCPGDAFYKENDTPLKMALAFVKG